MNRYRLAAHFASRSCDGLVKRFGLSSPTLPASLLLLLLLLFLLLHQHQHQHIANTSLCIALFFSLHATTAPSRGGSKANQRGSRSLGIFETKDESRGCVHVGIFYGIVEGGEGGESRSRMGDFIEFCSPLLLFIDSRPILTTHSRESMRLSLD